MTPKLLLLDLGGTGFALRVEEVVGILDPPRIFPLPRLPEAFQGVFLHHGETIPLLGEKALADRVEEPSGTTCLVVLCTCRAGTVGLPARRVDKIVLPETGTWQEDPRRPDGSAGKLFLWEGRSYRLLDLETLLQSVAPKTQAGHA